MPTVFISYSHESADHIDRVLSFANRLRADGIDAMIDQFQQFPPGGWPDWAERHVENAEYVLIVCTETYRKRAERRDHAGQGLGVIYESRLIQQILYNSGGENSRFIPVLLNGGHKDHIPLRLQSYRVFDCSSAGGYDRLVRLLRGEPDVAVASLGVGPAPMDARPRLLDFRNVAWNVPHARNPFFTGREEVLEALHTALLRNNTAALTQAITGLGGIGKSQVAVEYAYRHRGDYDAIFWVPAQDEASITAAFLELGRLVSVPGIETAPEHVAVSSIRKWLESNSGWLLVFDNADDPERLLPYRVENPGGRTLLTSRAQLFDRLGIARPLELDVMDEGDAIEFLLRRAGRDDAPAAERHAAGELAGMLGCLPLALEQAAAYVLEKQVRFADYLDVFRKRGAQLLEIKSPLAQSVVRTTWAINFTEIEKEPASAAILKASAFLYPDDIPLALLSEGGYELGEGVRAVLGTGGADALTVAEVLAPLTRYSLIRRHVDNGSYSIHRLVQAVIRDSFPAGEEWAWGECVVRAINRAATSPELFMADSFNRQIEAAAKMIERLNLSTPQSAELLFGFAARRRPYNAPLEDPGESERARERVSEILSQIAEAERHLSAALRVLDATVDADPALKCAVGNHLGEVYLAQDRLDEAETILQAAVATGGSDGGAERVEPGTLLHNLGRVHLARRMYPQARDSFESARKERERRLGSGHPATARTLFRLGEVALQLEMVEYAEQLAVRSLATVDRAGYSDDVKGGVSEEYLWAADVLGLLMRIRVAKGDVAGAARFEVRQILTSLRTLELDDWFAVSFLCRRAHEAREDRHAGFAERSDVLTGEARAIFERVAKTATGDDLGKLNAVSAIAAVYAVEHDAKGVDLAFPWMLRLTEAKYGPDHPEVARCLRAWGIGLFWQERDSEAEPLFARAIEIYERHGGNYDQLGSLYEHYAQLLERTGRRREEKEKAAPVAAHASNLSMEHPRIRARQALVVSLCILITLVMLYMVFV